MPSASREAALGRTGPLLPTGAAARSARANRGSSERSAAAGAGVASVEVVGGPTGALRGELCDGGGMERLLSRASVRSASCAGRSDAGAERSDAGAGRSAATPARGALAEDGTGVSAVGLVTRGWRVPADHSLRR